MPDEPDDDIADIAEEVSLPDEGMEEGIEEGIEGSADTLSEGGKSLTDRLLSTQPNPPLEEVESPWNPEEGGITRMYRGVQKMGEFDGLPAIADIFIGAMEEVQNSDLGAQSSPGESDDGDSEWVIPE